MGVVHKLAHDDFTEDDFQLFAIHTTLEIYRLVYFLNKKLKLQLKYSCSIDSFELFEYVNKQQQREVWSLVSNTGMQIVKKPNTDTLIFDQEPAQIKTYLLPEHKNVDYFLKIENDSDNKNIISSISNIIQVITTFEIDVKLLKSKNNLNFH